jgi:hypothetical protein
MMTDNVVPLFKGRRILNDHHTVIDPERYARVPDLRAVQLSLPTELVVKIDELAARASLPRSALLRVFIIAAMREANREQALA